MTADQRDRTPPHPSEGSTHGPLRVGFVLQGEGRGHMTQAITLAAALRDAGHEIVHVRLGGGPEWPIPDFFGEAIAAPVTRFTGPTHIPDAAGREIDVGRTTTKAILRLPTFVTAALGHRRQFSAARCDVIVAFFDVISGFARALRVSTIPTVVLGHHYLLSHPKVVAPPLGTLPLKALRFYVRTSEWRSERRLALSFRDLGGTCPPRLVVTPPLLRNAVHELESTNQGHLLAYSVTPGSGDHVVAWHRKNPDVPVHLYISGGESSLSQAPGDGCHVHDIDPVTFLDHMASCRAFVTSAGFESLCEAHYLGKPVLAVPTPNQIEQTFNAADAEAAGVARAGTFADLDDFWETCTPPNAETVTAFRAWVDSGPAKAVSVVEEAAR